MMKPDMTSIDPPIRLATRASPLALAQTEEVCRLLAPHRATVEKFSTRGDDVIDRPLADIGGKGLFVKRLEKALLAGQADAAVHSAKDLESYITQGTALVAFLEREDRRDALVGPYETLDDIPHGKAVGTASVRRAAIIRAIRPDLEIKLLRGNVHSRLHQLAEGHYDAIILAMAGLKRLGITNNVHPIEESVMLPAAGQGVLALQASDSSDSRGQQIHSILAALNHYPSASEITAERAVLATLNGTCHTPVAASAHYAREQIHLTAKLMSLDGQVVVEAMGKISADEAEKLGKDVGQELLEAVGGHDFIMAQQPTR